MKNRHSHTAVVVSLALASAFAAAQNAISVTVDGRPLNFPGTGPQMVNGRVLVPLRGIFESLGAYVQWNAAQQEVIANRGQNNIRLQIANPTATVDGRNVTLDVPAQVVNGATLVPIRFVSEALGADCKWQEAQQLVLITSGRVAPPPVVINSPPPPVIIAPYHTVPISRPRPTAELMLRNTVIPCSLDDTLRSNGSQRGDTFTATVQTQGSNMYGYLPSGSRLAGQVVAARPRRVGDPGVLELAFTRLLLPDGTSYPIVGHIIDLHDQDVARDEHGLWVARGAAAVDDRRIFAGFGSGPGVVLSFSDRRPLASLQGGIVMYFGGGPDIDRTRPRDIFLRPGTPFGVRLMRDVMIRGRDLRH